MKKLLVTLPDGSLASRRTERAYTHVVAVRVIAKTTWTLGSLTPTITPCEPHWAALSWHQGAVNAAKGLATAQKSATSQLWSSIVLAEVR